MHQFQHLPRFTDCSSKNEIQNIIPLYKERINYSIIRNILNELKLYSFLFKGSDFQFPNLKLTVSFILFLVHQIETQFETPKGMCALVPVWYVVFSVFIKC
jgi:hypothetical protein